MPSRPRPSETRGTCPRCAQRVRVSVPRGGDGSARVCATHTACDPEANDVPVRCPGSRMICVEDRRP